MKKLIVFVVLVAALGTAWLGLLPESHQTGTHGVDRTGQPR